MLAAGEPLLRLAREPGVGVRDLGLGDARFGCSNACSQVSQLEGLLSSAGRCTSSSLLMMVVCGIPSAASSMPVALSSELEASPSSSALLLSRSDSFEPKYASRSFAGVSLIAGRGALLDRRRVFAAPRAGLGLRRPPGDDELRVPLLADEDSGLRRLLSGEASGELRLLQPSGGPLLLFGPAPPERSPPASRLRDFRLVLVGCPVAGPFWLRIVARRISCHCMFGSRCKKNIIAIDGDREVRQITTAPHIRRRRESPQRWQRPSACIIEGRRQIECAQYCLHLIE